MSKEAERHQRRQARADELLSTLYACRQLQLDPEIRNSPTLVYGIRELVRLTLSFTRDIQAVMRVSRADQEVAVEFRLSDFRTLRSEHLRALELHEGVTLQSTEDTAEFRHAQRIELIDAMRYALTRVKRSTTNAELSDAAWNYIAQLNELKGRVDDLSPAAIDVDTLEGLGQRAFAEAEFDHEVETTEDRAVACLANFGVEFIWPGSDGLEL